MEDIIYALCSDKHIVYIGRSTKYNFKKRISSHNKTKEFDNALILCENIKCRFLIYPVNPVGILEGFFINKLNPPLNKTKHNDFAILNLIRKNDLIALLPVECQALQCLGKKEIIDNLIEEKKNIINILDIKYSSPLGYSFLNLNIG